MKTSDFWHSVETVIADGFTPEGLKKLEHYAELLIANRLVYKRFSPREQHGCAAGGSAHVIASILAGASAATSSGLETSLSDFKREQQRAETQALEIERWARKTGCWFDKIDETLIAQFGEKIAEGGEAQVYFLGTKTIKTIGLDYYIQPLLALDRITLHNAWFPETRLTVLGFGRTTDGSFVIIAEQPYIQGSALTDTEISAFARSLGFELKNPRNWTFTTPEIYLSDLHDENVIRSAEGNIFVIDCDIRLNTPDLRQGGTREISNEIVFNPDSDISLMFFRN